MSKQWFFLGKRHRYNHFLFEISCSLSSLQFQPILCWQRASYIFSNKSNRTFFFGYLEGSYKQQALANQLASQLYAHMKPSYSFLLDLTLYQLASQPANLLLPTNLPKNSSCSVLSQTRVTLLSKYQVLWYLQLSLCLVQQL